MECQTPNTGSHSFDPYGAMTAYFAFILFIVYGSDAFYKYKEWNLLKDEMKNQGTGNISGKPKYRTNVELHEWD